MHCEYSHGKGHRYTQFTGGIDDTTYTNPFSDLHQELFYGVQREIVNELIDCAIVLMVDTLLDSVREYFHASESQVEELVCLFISKLPENWRMRFQMPKTA